MGQISEKCVGMKKNKSHMVSWHKLAPCAFQFSQIIPFVSEDILIPHDLKLPMNQGWNKRPPTVFAVNLLSPFEVLNLGSQITPAPHLASIYSINLRKALVSLQMLLYYQDLKMYNRVQEPEVMGRLQNWGQGNETVHASHLFS